MDPISVISATISIATNGANLLQSIISQTTNVDRDLQQLHQEVNSLNEILAALRNLYGDQLETGNVTSLKNILSRTVRDCQVILRDLDGLLLRINSHRQGALGRVITAAVKNYRTSDIIFFQKVLDRHIRGLNFALVAMAA